MNSYKLLLLTIVANKKKASEMLSNHFDCKSTELFYKYLKNDFPDSGRIKEDTAFLFHGYGCSVSSKIEGWKVDLEFGPKGNTLAFDQYTICHECKIEHEKCHDFIQMLIRHNIIRLVDEKLNALMSINSESRGKLSELEDMDLCVADRYILIES